MRAVASAALLLLALAAPTDATGTATLTVGFDASLTFPFDEPAFTSDCTVTVPAGSDGRDVLDAAVTAGCIDAWDFDTHPLFGAFLTGITGPGNADSTDARGDAGFVCNAPAVGGDLFYSFWGIEQDGGAAPTGIDGYSANDGDSLRFEYVVDTCASALGLGYAFTGVGPTSPVPLAGNDDTDPGA